MKITRRQLRRIIKEELSRALLGEGILDRSSSMLADEKARSKVLSSYIGSAKNELQGTRGGESLWKEKLDKHDTRDALVQELKDEGKLKAFQGDGSSGSVGMRKAKAEIEKIVKGELERVASAFDEDNKNGDLESWSLVGAYLNDVE